MKPACPHNRADPRRCPDCRKNTTRSGTEDPDIRARWVDFRRGLEAMLRPYVQEHLLEELALRAAAELLAGPGWRPPLKTQPDWMRDARVRRAMIADDTDPPTTPSA